MNSELSETSDAPRQNAPVARKTLEESLFGACERSAAELG